MRALHWFAAAFIVVSCAGFTLARDLAPATPPRDAGPHLAPIPATVGTGLAIIGGLLIARYIRRRPD